MLQITGPLPTEKKKNTPTKLCSVTNPYTTFPVPSTTALSVSAYKTGSLTNWTVNPTNRAIHKCKPSIHNFACHYQPSYSGYKHLQKII